MFSNKSTLMLLVSAALSLAACTPETGADDEEVEAVGTVAGDDFDVDGDDVAREELHVVVGVDADRPELDRRFAPDGLAPTELGPQCPFYLAPVCGVDGETYASPCVAKLRGVEVAHPGLCEVEDGLPPSLPLPGPEAGEILKDQLGDFVHPV